MSSSFKVSGVPESASAVLTFRNSLFCSRKSFELFKKDQTDPKEKWVLVNLKGMPYRLEPLDHIKDDMENKIVALPLMMRKFRNLEFGAQVRLTRIDLPEKDPRLSIDEMTVSVRVYGSKSHGPPIELNCEDLSKEIVKQFCDSFPQVLCKGMFMPFRFNEKIFTISVVDLALFSPVPTTDKGESTRTLGRNNPEAEVIKSLLHGMGGYVDSATKFVFSTTDTRLRLYGQASQSSAKKIMNTNFEDLGIGGLDSQFNEMFRRAFSSRVIRPEMVRKLGIKHVKGMMLHGPPGTGKTLIARQISSVLQGASETAPKPKVISGPSVLNKYVGESEKNIRDLFAEAEADQADKGDASELHVIIFDEIDSICKQRGSRSDGTGVGDNVVNQLLSKIDGVDALNNVLLIGMTNRVDLIDPALLRPGRFEVMVEIGLPDEEGRAQILNIHTKRMSEEGYLSSDIDIPAMAAKTKNYSGAELEGVVRSALSFATWRHMQTEDCTKSDDFDSIVVTKGDFSYAMNEIRPAFGLQGEDELQTLYVNGVFNIGERFDKLDKSLDALMDQSKTGKLTPLLSVLLHGEHGSGKTALIAYKAVTAGFPFTKLIRCDKMVGLSEGEKCNQIKSIFEDAYKSPLSLIVIDDIERLIDFVPIGPRFSNLVLQALLVLINRPPPIENRKLMIVATTSVNYFMDQVGLSSVFNVSLRIPLLEHEREIKVLLEGLMNYERHPLKLEDSDLNDIAKSCPLPIAVKTFLNVIEMARQEDKENGEKITARYFIKCLEMCSLIKRE